MKKPAFSRIERAAARWVIEHEAGTMTPRQHQNFNRWIAAAPEHERTFRLLRASNEYATRTLRLLRQLHRSAKPH